MGEMDEEEGKIRRVKGEGFCEIFFFFKKFNYHYVEM